MKKFTFSHMAITWSFLRKVWFLSCFFYFHFRCCFVEKIKFPLRNAFNFSGWKTGTTHVFWAESKKSKIRKEKSFQFFDFFDSAQKRWFIKKQKIDFFVFWWIIFSGRNRKNQKSGRKILSSFLIFSIPPRKDDSSKNRKIDFLFFDESSFLGGMEKIKKLEGFFFPDFWFYQFRPENMIHQEIKNVGGGRQCFFRPIYRSISTYLTFDFWNIYILKNLKHSLSSTARLM